MKNKILQKDFLSIFPYYFNFSLMKLVIFVSVLFISFFSKAIAQTNPDKTQ